MRSARLHTKGLHLPDDILIDDAIDEVLAIIERAACDHQRADEPVNWFMANIQEPMDYGACAWAPLHSA
jgi:hypothetical protein